MKNIISFMIFGGLMFFGLPSLSSAKVNIFACEPEWKSLADEIGGDKVEVISATNAFQDPHFIRAKPSLIAKMRRADLVFCSGADLEVGWLPVLLQKSGSQNVQDGQIGSLMASDFVRRKAIPEHLDRSEGHIHPKGNPHVHLNPDNIVSIALELRDRLSILDGDNAKYYAERYASFEDEWKFHLSNWDKYRSKLRGMKVIVQHGSFLYLNDWLGIEQIADLEPKPGVPPTISHLEKLLKISKEEDVSAVILSPYQDDGGAKWLQERAGIPVVTLPYTVGGNAESNSLKLLFDSTISRLINAL